jgi:NADPH:quinone reductase-like Zn-dependent oxidoreductase
MKAIVQYAYGSVDVLELRDVDKPLVADHDVCVHAAGVNPGVWHLMTGVPYLMRILGAGLLKPKNGVAGEDVAGRRSRPVLGRGSRSRKNRHHRVRFG